LILIAFLVSQIRGVAASLRLLFRSLRWC